jgi:hypothetical protein
MLLVPCPLRSKGPFGYEVSKNCQRPTFLPKAKPFFFPYPKGLKQKRSNKGLLRYCFAGKKVSKKEGLFCLILPSPSLHSKDWGFLPAKLPTLLCLQSCSKERHRRLRGLRQKRREGQLCMQSRGEEGSRTFLAPAVFITPYQKSRGQKKSKEREREPIVLPKR